MQAEGDEGRPRLHCTMPEARRSSAGVATPVGVFNATHPPLSGHCNHTKTRRLCPLHVFNFYCHQYHCFSLSLFLLMYTIKIMGLFWSLSVSCSRFTLESAWACRHLRAIIDARAPYPCLIIIIITKRNSNTRFLVSFFFLSFSFSKKKTTPVPHLWKKKKSCAKKQCSTRFSLIKKLFKKNAGAKKTWKQEHWKKSFHKTGQEKLVTFSKQ